MRLQSPGARDGSGRSTGWYRGDGAAVAAATDADDSQGDEETAYGYHVRRMKTPFLFPTEIPQVVEGIFSASLRSLKPFQSR